MARRVGRNAIFLAIHFLIVLLAFTAGWFLGPGGALPEAAPLVSLTRYRPLVYLVAEDYARSNDITLGRAVFTGWDYRLLSRELTLVAEQEEDEDTREGLIVFRDALVASRGGSLTHFEPGTELRQFLESLLQDRTLFWSAMVVAAIGIALFTTAVFFALRVLTRPPQSLPPSPTTPDLVGNAAMSGAVADAGIELAQPAPRPVEGGEIGETYGNERQHDATISEGESLATEYEAPPIPSDAQAPASPPEETDSSESRQLDAHTLVGELPEIDIAEIAESSQWILARLREKNRTNTSNPR